MKNIESLIEKWEKEFDFYKEKLDTKKCEDLDQLYMSHFETRQIRAFIDDLKNLTIEDCSTCKHQKVSKYVEPCYGCRDNDGYDNYE